jgi:HD-like signal output (HDOD) protein
MPGMDGAELLERVKKEFPDTIRFALSGQSDQETWMRSLGSAHQFLSKPCNPEKLRHLICQASALREKLSAEKVRNAVSAMGSLPSLPKVYDEIMLLMQKPDCSLGEIAAAVGRDVAMTAKVLQLVNSASVGLHTHIASPAQAVSLLGLGTLRAMVLLVHVFENFRVRDPVLLSFFESFHVHSMAVSQAARRIAQAESQNKNLVQEASIAGMLHDIGQLIFASAYQDRYSRIIKEFALFQEREISEAEISEFGASHQDAGAYLLAIWGLSDPVVEAVAYHHSPAAAKIIEFRPLVAVHVADRLHPPKEIIEQKKDQPQPPLPPDAEFLAETGFDKSLDKWVAALDLKAPSS